MMNEFNFVCNKDGCHQRFKLKTHLAKHQNHCVFDNPSLDLLFTQNNSKEYNGVSADGCVETYNCSDHLIRDHPGNCSPVVSNEAKVVLD